MAKVLGRENIDHGFYGQEIDLTTYNLCRINMFLHSIDPDKFSIVREDTLLSPQPEYSARDCAARPLKLSIHSGGIEHACRRR